MKVLLDSMGSAAQWSALLPDGQNASTEIAIAADSNVFQLTDDRTSIRFTVSDAAGGHRIRHTLAAPQDLSNLSEIRFWIRADRAADGSESAPFLLQLKLGSAAVPVGSAANTWFRNAPVGQPNTWELVHVSLDDLPASIRGAVNRVEFLCAQSNPAQIFYIDSIIAVREELLTDVEAALAGALHEKLQTADQTKIPAVVHNPDGPAPVAPQIRIYLTEIRMDESRNTYSGRRDFAGQAFRLQLPLTGYGFIYELEAIAGEPDTRSRIVDFLLASFAPRNTLEVNAVPLPIEWQPRRPWRALMALPERFRLRFKIKAWQSAGSTQPVTRPFNDVNLTLGGQEVRTI